MDILFTSFYSFIACVGFCLVANVKLRKKMLLCASMGGAIGYGVFLSLGFMNNAIVQSFAAMLVVTVYAETLSRIFKTPASVYLIVALIPLVPGGGIYYTMEKSIQGETMEFINTGLQTFGIAGAIALGIFIASSIFRMVVNIKKGANKGLK